jgi:hypothetical protein
MMDVMQRRRAVGFGVALALIGCALFLVLTAHSPSLSANHAERTSAMLQPEVLAKMSGGGAQRAAAAERGAGSAAVVSIRRREQAAIGWCNGGGAWRAMITGMALARSVERAGLFDDPRFESAAANSGGSWFLMQVRGCVRHALLARRVRA